MTEKLSYEAEARANKDFESAHEDGAKRFGAMWLRANVIATEAALYFGVDATKLKIKALLTRVVYRVLAMSEAANVALLDKARQEQAEECAKHTIKFDFRDNELIGCHVCDWTGREIGTGAQRKLFQEHIAAIGRK